MDRTLLATSPGADTLVEHAPAPGRGACRFCSAPLRHTFVDLGMSPLCESYLRADQINDMEPFYPLHVYVCDVCWLVQLQEYVGREEIFTEYAYFSSYSQSWLEHAARYAEVAPLRVGLDPSSLVLEVASNDGYMLRNRRRGDSRPRGGACGQRRRGDDRRGQMADVPEWGCRFVVPVPRLEVIL